MEDSAKQGSLPTRKIFVFIVVLAALLTLVLVHLTGQWVGQLIFANGQDGRHRLQVDSTQTKLKTHRRKIQTVLGYEQSEKWIPARHQEKQHSEHQKDEETDWKDIFLTEERDQTKFKSRKQSKKSGWPLDSDSGHQIPDVASAARAAIRASIPEVKKKAESNVYNWNDRDRTSHLSLPLRTTYDNNWKRENALIFNRVGKCGSRSVIFLLRKLAKRNSFNLLSSIVYNSTLINTEWQNYIVKTLDQMETPYLFQRHLYFVDFTSFEARQPTYINIIRDPISRFVSNYYFKRFGDGQSNQNYRGTETDKYRSVTKCVLEGLPECSSRGLFYIIPFFCGQNRWCRQPTQWALDAAKRNVEKHFVAVGILEDLEGTFRVFEKIMPHFFDGVVQLFLEPDEKQLKKNSSTLTKFKEKPSPEAEAVMREALKYEYDFYYFVKDRLDRLKEEYGIKTEIKQH